MADSFVCERDAFVAAWDRLGMADRKSFADFPDGADVRPALSQAEFVACQRDNPLRDFTINDLHAIDLADSFIRWATDPGNPERWREMFTCRFEMDADNDD